MVEARHFMYDNAASAATFQPGPRLVRDDGIDETFGRRPRAFARTSARGRSGGDDMFFDSRRPFLAAANRRCRRWSFPPEF